MHNWANIPVEPLFEDIRTVMRTLTTIERPLDGGASDQRYIARVLPYRSVDNFIAGVVITFTDVTPLTRAESALRVSEARFRAIFDSASDYAIFTMDKQRRLTAWSPGSQNLFGWEEPEIIGRSADIVYTEEDRADGAPEREAALAASEGRAQNERWHVRKDGSRFWGSGSMAPLGDGDLGYVKILRDRTEVRNAEERQLILTAELQHRVRNTLSVLRSIARRTAETTKTVEDFAMHFEGRLDAFARVQAAVTRNPLAGIGLEYLVAEELLAYGRQEGEQVSINGPMLQLRPKAAETLGLALHELATNAMKYGALSDRNGRIDVRWKIVRDDEPPSLHFEWTEEGMNLDGAQPSRHGFGLELLERTLAYELNAFATLDFRKKGLRCRIQLPLTERIAASGS